MATNRSKCSELTLYASRVYCQAPNRVNLPTLWINTSGKGILLNMTEGEPKVFMDQAEIDLWQMVDIKWFAASMAGIGDTLALIQSYLAKGEREKARDMLQRLRERFLHIIERIEEIDESLLDDRFPIEVIGTLKERGPGALWEVVSLAQSAIERGSLSQDVMSEILAKSNFLREMTFEFNKSPRYLEYRKLIGGQGRR